MAITAADLHAAARRTLDGPLAALGFRRVPKTSTASWLRAQEDRWLLLWFQPHRWNSTQSAGFKFTVELRLADRPVLYAAGPLARLPALLSGDHREELRDMENRVIARLPGPDMAFIGSLPEDVRATELAEWKPRLQSYRSDEDVWFRLGDHADLDALLAFIARVLPEAIDRFLVLKAERNGSTILVPGTRTWDRLVSDFDEGSGARVRQTVLESRAHPDALDEALALWREVFEEWLADRGYDLATMSPDELIRALDLDED